MDNKHWVVEKTGSGFKVRQTTPEEEAQRTAVGIGVILVGALACYGWYVLWM